MHLLEHAHHLLSAFFLGVIPWWFYVVASFSAAIIIIIELPNRLGLVLGLLAALILGDIGFTSKGYHLGYAASDAKWEAGRVAERKRLEDGFAIQLAAEHQRAEEALDEMENTRRERQNAIDSAPPHPGDPIVIPAVIATKLWLIGRPPLSTNHPAGHPSGPSKVPPVLLRHRQPSSP